MNVPETLTIDAEEKLARTQKEMEEY